MRKRLSLKSAFLLPVIFVGVFLLIEFSNGEDSQQGPAATPRATMVDKLEREAKARWMYYTENTQQMKELKASQKQQVSDLLEKHRVARDSFAKEKRTSEERKSFYRGQRDEMGSLKAKQRDERAKLRQKLIQDRK